MTIAHFDHQPAGGMPSGGVPAAAVPAGRVVGGEPERRDVAGVPTSWVHKTLTKILARLAAPEAGVVVTSADIQELERVARRVEAVRLALVAAADRQQVHRQFGHSSTSAWVASATRSDGGAAQRDVVLATALAGGLDRTRDAFEAGQMSSCLLYTSPSPRDRTRSRMPSSA